MSSFFSLLSVAAFMRLWQNWVNGTETLCPAKPKISTICPFTEKIGPPRGNNSNFCHRSLGELYPNVPVGNSKVSNHLWIFFSEMVGGLGCQGQKIYDKFQKFCQLLQNGFEKTCFTGLLWELKCLTSLGHGVYIILSFPSMLSILIRSHLSPYSTQFEILVGIVFLLIMLVMWWLEQIHLKGDLLTIVLERSCSRLWMYLTKDWPQSLDPCARCCHDFYSKTD